MRFRPTVQTLLKVCRPSIFRPTVFLPSVSRPSVFRPIVHGIFVLPSFVVASFVLPTYNRSEGWKLPSSCNICTSCTAMGPLTMHCSCSSYVTLKCRDYPTCGKRRAVTHCPIPPRNKGQGTGVHEGKWAKSTPPPPILCDNDIDI